MIWFYNIAIFIYGCLLRAAALFHPKAKLFVEGRKNIFSQISQKIKPTDRPIWFHFASLGEFEQGRPVLEAMRKAHPSEKIVLTFFSPSGYEIKKNEPLADAVFYLPLDTAANAKRWIGLIQPQMAIFTKYEFWLHYFNELEKNHVPLYMISVIFRPNQVFFSWYGRFYRLLLKKVRHFFVQNEESVHLLKLIGLSNVTLSGDTRFDRVAELAIHPPELPLASLFKGNSPVLIAGSTWPEDEKQLQHLPFIEKGWKMIIAPHEIGEEHLQYIEKLFPGVIRYSQAAADPTLPLDNYSIMLIDNIGLLSGLYAYGTIAYIGGGFGAGIHNTLEAAAYGLPVIFGPKYGKFQEAKDLIANGAALSISNETELAAAFQHFSNNQEAATAAKNYVSQKKGATKLIMENMQH